MYRIRFNYDEAGINIGSHRPRVATTRPTVRRSLSGQGGHITLGLTVRGDGRLLPFGYVLPGTNVEDLPTCIELDWGQWVAVQQNGFVTEEIFEKRFVPEFIRMLTQERSERQEPTQMALLTLDGHKSHLATSAPSCRTFGRRPISRILS